jgi:asparagine synthase (glutamine-hydrolysing)
MCGISGIFSSTPVDRTIVESMMLALTHRGPDAQGTYLDPTQTMAVGHTRLSIIDLGTGANQPFHSKDGRYVIVFNGEIYNFHQIKKELLGLRAISFRTQSDTEVLLEAFITWGSDMVQKLEGMFALAIMDQQEHKVFLFRDRVGKKPLYFFQSEGLFAFASEIKSLLKHPLIQREKEIDQQAVGTFLHLGYIPEPRTIYTRIHKFPAGHTGEVDRSLNLVTRPYWRIEDALGTRPDNSGGSRKLSGRDREEETRNHLSLLLDQSVQQRLISDVPLGAFLSGGTDSSLVTAIASQYVSPLKTFSIGFEESKFDESGYARAVARHLKTDHTEYIVSEKEAVDHVETYLRHFDEPFADTSAIPTMLVSKLARRDVKVVLTGDGGDELFQGYGAYTWANRLDRASWKLLKRPLQWVLESSGRHRFQRVAHLLEPSVRGSLRSHVFSQEQYYFSQREIHEKLLVRPSDSAPFEYDESLLANNNLSSGERQALFDLQYYLKDDLLVKVDRASMLYALECRCPLLDHRVIEYALALDVGMKRRGGITKWIIKQLLYQYVPRELVDRPKWGFSVPLATWMKGDLRYLMEDFLNDQVVEEAGWCKVDFIRTLKKEFLEGKDYLYHRLWVVIVLHKWWKENQ